MEEVLICRYHELDREEIRRMLKLHDIRTTRVWKEAYEQGYKRGLERGRVLEREDLVARLRASGQTLEEIALLLDISVAEVRRLVGR
jgi:predicted transposase YdaD